MADFLSPSPRTRSLGEVSQEAFSFSDVGDFILKQSMTFLDNLRRFNKDIVSSELQDWMRTHNEKPETLYKHLRILPHTPVLKPDGMTGTYSQVVPELLDLLRWSEFAQVIAALKKTLHRAIEKACTRHSVSANVFEYQWDKEVLHGLPVEDMRKTVTSIQKFSDVHFRVPKPVVGDFHKEFPSEALFTRTIASALLGAKFYTQIEDHQKDLTEIYRLCDVLVTKLKTNFSIDSTAKEKAVELLSDTGRYLDHVGVAVHEMFRIDHNLYLTIDTMYNPPK